MIERIFSRKSDSFKWNFLKILVDSENSYIDFAAKRIDVKIKLKKDQN